MTKINDIIPEGDYKLAFPDPPKREINILRFSTEAYKKMVLYNAARALQFKGGEQSFIIDKYNTTVINQLYLYLVGSPDFDGNLNNGIILIGKIGSGKTLLMRIFVDIVLCCINKNIHWIHSKDIESTVIANGQDYYKNRPICIDDIGKEQEQIKDFGTTRKPFEDLISYRYGKQNITFGTSNLTLEDMPYSYHTKDRLREICNIMILDGGSRR